MDGKPAEDQEEKVAAEIAETKAKLLAELEAAVESGEYKEPISMLEWIKSQESTSPTIKAAIAKQLDWYRLADEEEMEYGEASGEDESDNMDDAARNERELARQERKDSGL